MSITKIEQNVLQLNYRWFEEKKSFFVKETFYNKKAGKIYDWLPVNDHFDEEANTFIKQEPDIIDIDFKKYCWNSYYPYCLNSNEYNDIDLPIDGSDVSGQILSEIDKMILEIKTDEAKDNIISAARDTIIETIEDLQKGHETDSEYLEVLNDFLLRARKGINDKHGEFKKVYSIASKYQDKLLFDLKQDELAVLLQILFDAGFIHTSTANDITYLAFYKKYFHFQNQRKGNTYTLAVDIAKRLSDVRSEDISNRSLKKVTGQLQKALNNFAK